MFYLRMRENYLHSSRDILATEIGFIDANARSPAFLAFGTLQQLLIVGCARDRPASVKWKELLVRLNEGNRWAVQSASQVALSFPFERA